MITAAALSALPWGRIVPALVLLAAVGAGIAWHVHRVDLARKQGATAGRAEIRAQWDKATIDDQQFAARLAAERRLVEQQRQAAARQEVQDAQEAHQIARGDADRARADVDRLRVAAKATGARCGAPGRDPAPAAASASAAGAGDVLADVLGRLGEAGAELAAEADRRGIAGAVCERLYGSVQSGSVGPQ